MRVPTASDILIRNTRPSDIPSIQSMCSLVYSASPPWSREQLLSHQRVFPEGQFVAEQRSTGRILGMAASLIVYWDDYDFDASWREFTDGGWFTNHDPEQGRTLYGAEVMVHPDSQGMGIGKKLYAARRKLVQRLGLYRIRAGARLRGYGRYADRMTPVEYVRKVVAGELGDPTLSFQLKQGFHVLAVVSDYLPHDPESRGYAALIEWLNPHVSATGDWRSLDPRLNRLREQDRTWVKISRQRGPAM